MPWFSEQAETISPNRLEELIQRTAQEARERICRHPKRVLLLPPDITRAHSGAGRLTELLYRDFAREAEVHVIPTLGQHVPHTPEQNRRMFGSIPEERIHAHDWRGGCVKLGEVPAEFVRQATGGAADWPIPVVLNRMLVEGAWDLVINVGQVVPHEVLGFANHNKNYFIGLAGKEMICAAHMAAACYGIENNVGSLVPPVRACFNKAEQDFLGGLPDLYVLVVMARSGEDGLVHTGFYVGDDPETYLAAARQSRQHNVTVLDEAIPKIVCLMQGDEFFSTWVANKAIYRTRMAIADGGQLLVIAPGLKRFGEQPEVDALIRKYGYIGTPRIMELYRRNADLQDLTHGTAHLMHGSTEGRFSVIYAPGHMSQQEIEGVNFQYADLNQALQRYPPDRLREGWNELPDGERVYFIPSPSVGLWATRQKLFGRPPGPEGL
ncbi:MAG: lactate racemase domain-containing protein [Thermoguttaceae bacterium]